MQDADPVVVDQVRDGRGWRLVVFDGAAGVPAGRTGETPVPSTG
jgi:hypothetical protein